MSGHACLCVSGIVFASFEDFSIGFWNCLDSVVCFAFHFCVKTFLCQSNAKDSGYPTSITITSATSLADTVRYISYGG